MVNAIICNNFLISNLSSYDLKNNKLKNRKLALVTKKRWQSVPAFPRLYLFKLLKLINKYTKNKKPNKMD